MKTKLLVATLLAGSSLFAETHFSIGIGVGGHGYAAPPVMAYRPHSPGPGYIWVDGYWDRVGPRRFWREGYWARPSYRRGFAIAPRYDGNRYGNGYTQNGYNGQWERPERNIYGGSADGRNAVNGGSSGFTGGTNGTNPNGNRSGNFSNGNWNSTNGNFSNGTSSTGYNGHGSNGNDGGRFNNPNGRR